MKILIAEDDSSLRRALTSILQKNNYSVDAVDNGGDAYDYLCSGMYDAAILDIMMPVADGVSVLVRARKENCKTPVLLLTAKSETDDKITGLHGRIFGNRNNPRSIKFHTLPPPFPKLSERNPGGHFLARRAYQCHVLKVR